VFSASVTPGPAKASRAFFFEKKQQQSLVSLSRYTGKRVRRR
jgi:hypothetical protein